MAKLDGKVALVTGAARGIGRAIAEAFARDGAFVWVTDVRDAEGAGVADGLGAFARYEHLDVRVEEGWERVTEAVMTEHDRLDVLVNNAGITGFEGGPAPHDPEHVTLDIWRSVLATNLEGTVLGCRYAIRCMRRHGTGSIINMGSRSGLVGIPRAAPYAASKAAIRNHTRTVALYCAEEGLAIRCNAIHPAAILTPMWEPLLGDGPDREDRIAEYVKDVPARRMGTPAEVASLAVWLASDDSAYATGTDFSMDGGMLAGTAVPPRPAE